MYFFFTATSNTEIYTVLHTLPLPDALPISSSRIVSTHLRYAERRPLWVLVRYWPRTRICTYSTLRRRLTGSPWSRVPGRSPWPLSAAATRTEEHTSELQSIMRISYAVFCLQNQQTTINKKDTNKP